MKKLSYAYAIIHKEDNRCVQTLHTSNGNFHIDNATDYSVVIDPAYVDEYLDKYYYNSQWWERLWSEVDEYGQPAEGATYADVEWIPGGEG